MARDLSASGTGLDLDAVDAVLLTYAAVMREVDVPFRAADGVAHRLAGYVPALVAEVRRLRAVLVDERAAHAKTVSNFEEYVQVKAEEVGVWQAKVRDLADRASDYDLICDEVAARLIGDGWDDDAAEVAILIGWARHMAAVHPDCPGRFCQAAHRRPVEQVLDDA